MSRTVRALLTVVVVSAMISVRAAEQPSAENDAALRRQVEARFDVVPLRDGIALAGRTADRRIEIDRGVILSHGTPLSGDELRRRLGADADLVLRLSYLDNAELRRVFAPATPPVVSRVPPPPGASAPPAPPTPPPAPVATPTPTPPLERATPASASPVFHRTGARLGVAKPIVIAVDEEVTDGVFSLGGPVRIEGRVRDNVIVVGSDLELTPTAEVHGDLTVVGGTARIADGARHAGAVHRVTGTPWARPTWPSLGWAWFEPGGAASWLPLAGTTVRILLLAVAMAALAVLARGRIVRIGAAAVATPIRAGLVGLAAQALFVPALIVLALLLAITIVGLPFVAVVVPLAVLAMLAVMVLGVTGLAVRLGQRVAGDRDGGADRAVATALAGLAVIVGLTFLARLLGAGPGALGGVAIGLLVVGTVVEYLAWTIGLGATILTGLGRWSLVPPPVPPVPPAPFTADAVVEPSPLL